MVMMTSAAEEEDGPNVDEKPQERDGDGLSEGDGHGCKQTAH